MDTFGLRLKGRLLAKKMSYRDLHKCIVSRFNVNSNSTSESYINKYANGSVSPTLKTVQMIADILDVSASYLAYGVSEISYLFLLDEIHQIVINEDQFRIEDVRSIIKNIIDRGR